MIRARDSLGRCVAGRHCRDPGSCGPGVADACGEFLRSATDDRLAELAAQLATCAGEHRAFAQLPRAWARQWRRSVLPRIARQCGWPGGDLAAVRGGFPEPGRWGRDLAAFRDWMGGANGFGANVAAVEAAAVGLRWSAHGAGAQLTAAQDVAAAEVVLRGPRRMMFLADIEVRAGRGGGARLPPGRLEGAGRALVPRAGLAPRLPPLRPASARVCPAAP